MRKLFIEGFVIFASILASFWVDNYRQKNEEKAILNDSIITLGNEITKNIEYTKEHIYQVKNLLQYQKKEGRQKMVVLSKLVAQAEIT